MAVDYIFWGLVAIGVILALYMIMSSVKTASGMATGTPSGTPSGVMTSMPYSSMAPYTTLVPYTVGPSPTYTPAPTPTGNSNSYVSGLTIAYGATTCSNIGTNTIAVPWHPAQVNYTVNIPTAAFNPTVALTFTFVSTAGSYQFVGTCTTTSASTCGGAYIAEGTSPLCGVFSSVTPNAVIQWVIPGTNPEIIYNFTIVPS